MLLSLVLFGSRARGDNRITSDIDLLGVVEGEKKHNEIVVNGASFYEYSLTSLAKMADQGDLFMLHLAKEAKILHDTGNVFETICNKFTFKEHYENEVLGASALMLFILSSNFSHLDQFVRKRLIWCLRTILVARSAERRLSNFSSKDLANFAEMPNLQCVIDNRYDVDFSDIYSACIAVYLNFGADLGGWPEDVNLTRIVDIIVSSKGVPKSTFNSLIKQNHTSKNIAEAAETYA